MPFVVKPTSADLIVANAAAKHASPIPEEIASILTLAADEGVAGFGGSSWLRSRRSSSEPVIYNHAWLFLLSAVLPHLLKPCSVRRDRIGDGAGSFEEYPFPGGERMLFRRDMRCTWEHSHHCQLATA